VRAVWKLRRRPRQQYFLRCAAQNNGLGRRNNSQTLQIGRVVKAMRKAIFSYALGKGYFLPKKVRPAPGGEQ
jgi:hypothetical protein